MYRSQRRVNDSVEIRCEFELKGSSGNEIAIVTPYASVPCLNSSGKRCVNLLASFGFEMNLRKLKF